MRYYDAYDAGAFRHQRPFCEAAGELRAALETPDANPLTLRLVIARTALSDLEALLERASGPLMAQRREAALRWGVPVEQVRLEAVPQESHRGEAWWVAAAALNDPTRPGQVYVPLDAEQHAFPLMEAHRHVTLFFDGICGALDRLARELTLLYQVNQSDVTWGHFARRRSRVFAALKEKDPAVSAWVSGLQATRLLAAVHYRNLIAREGLLPVAVDIEHSIRRWYLRTLSDPQAPEASLDRDVLGLCRSLFADALEVIDLTYYALLHRARAEGPPPW